VPPFIVTPATVEKGQPAGEVGLVVVVVEVAPNAPSFILAKRK